MKKVTHFKVTKTTPNGQKASVTVESDRYRTVRGYMQHRREEIKRMMLFQKGDSITVDIVEQPTPEWYYFVTEGKVTIGFNLTEEEKNELFYHIDKGDGHRSSGSRSYGALPFKCENEFDFRVKLKLRASYLTTTKNGWRSTAINLYDALNVAYEQLKEENSDGHLSGMISQLSQVIIDAERNNGIHYNKLERV